MPKERRTCTECSMRRQKCDREQPCSRCVKRGEPDKCTREWPKGGYDPKVHRTYPRPNKALSPDTDGDRTSPISKGTQEQLQSSSDHRIPSLERDLASCKTVSFSTVTRNQEKNAATTEVVQWGRVSTQDYQTKSFELLREPWKNNGGKEGQLEFSNGFGNTNVGQIAFLQLLLPRRDQIFHIVEYHVRDVLWYNNNFHGKTFLEELKRNHDRPGGFQIRDIDLRWVALLFAIMAGTMTCTTDQHTLQWGFAKGERGKFARQWYKASVNCLNMADYTWRHHINSVQTICILTLSAHTLGFSNTHTTLLGAVIKIAQGLGMQRLELEPEEANSLATPTTDTSQQERILRKEIGRRLWLQICTQDWFSIPFSEMYLIQKLHFTSTPPRHIDDETLLPMPLDTPSLVSFSKCINEIAAIMPEHHDALLTAATLYTKYEQVLHFDAKLKTLTTEGFPTYFSQNTPIASHWPHWLPWARRSLRITVAHKTIMIHRSFLGRSFTDVTFDYTRRTSLESAKTVLQEAKHFYDDSSGPSIWVDQAHMVAAGITLSLDIFHRQASDPKLEEHRKLVELAITMLGKLDASMIAIRGLRLLSSLLAEQARLAAAQSMSEYKSRKRSADPAPSSSTNEGIPDSAYTQNSIIRTVPIDTTPQQKRQKFDIPNFVQNFVGLNSSFAENLSNGVNTSTPSQIYETAHNVLNGRMPGFNANSFMQGGFGDALPSTPMQNMNLVDITPQHAQVQNVQVESGDSMGGMGIGSSNFEYNYGAFDEIFPPQAGISNDFLFGDLLNFEL